MATHPRRSRIVRAVALGVSLVATACGVETGSRPLATRAPSVAGQHAASSSTTTTSPRPRPPGVTITGDDGNPVNVVIANAIADLQDFWAVTMPEVFQKRYQRVIGGFYAADPQGGLPPCATKRSDIAGNAYYCYGGNLVAWDQVGLMPTLRRSFGDFTVAVVMAHEWGHAIQDRVGFSGRTVTKEMQADCYAGAWVRHIARGESPRFTIDVGILDQALAGLLSLRDRPGGSADDPAAHGSGFDRVSAFQTGYEHSAAQCATFRDGHPVPLELPFTASGGNLPYATIVPRAFRSLEGFWSAAYPQVQPGGRWQPLAAPRPFRPSAPPTCGGTPAAGYALFFCVPSRFIAYDDEIALPKIYRDAGGFAIAALFGTQYGLAVQYRKGDASSDEEAATLRGDCYMGAWAGSLLPHLGNASPLVLSSGDLDEAVAALLVFRGQGDRQRQGPGFNRVLALRAGVLKGVGACTNDLKGTPP
ncbi:MAG: peptidase [Acidimicrobiales bacterium]|nr:peptidase [Acidimicrobiales bacterium]